MTVQEAEAVVEQAVTEARQPVRPRADSLTVTDLLDLWHGDGYSDGFAHPNLVLAVCRIVDPPNLKLLIQDWVYPDVPLNELSPRVVKLISVGYRLWLNEKF